MTIKEDADRVAAELLPCRWCDGTSEYRCPCSTRPAVSTKIQALMEQNARMRAALESIDTTCQGEIEARFGGSSVSSIEKISGGSRVYSLLVVPRNIARAALNGDAS